MEKVVNKMMANDIVNNIKDEKNYLENKKFHAIFTLDQSQSGTKTPTLDSFICYPSASYKEAMMYQITENIASENKDENEEKDLNKDREHHIISEVKAIKIRAIFTNNLPIMCVHSDSKLEREDIEAVIASKTVDELKKFLEESKIKC